METIWLDALQFEEYGSFLPETQFVREMGQGYLLENAVGSPGAPCKTTFVLKEEGWYRVFVRTKNWFVEQTPDSLVVSIDDTPSQTRVGSAHIASWHFAPGGDFYLSKGRHVLSVASTTGWFGRFSAIILTNDKDYLPSPEESRWREDRKRYFSPVVSPFTKDIFKPVSHPKADLVVVGGGAAGVVAAIAAARKGLKTILISDRPVLGGNGSTESSVALEGATHRGVHERGIILEIKLYRHHHRCSWSEAFSHFVKQEKHLILFTNLLVDKAKTAPVTDRNDASSPAADAGDSPVSSACADAYTARILSLHALDTFTLREHRFTADYYIDATGDGWLGYEAGALMRYGREARWEHQEPLGQQESDAITMSGCSMVPTQNYATTLCSYDAEETAAPVPFVAPAWAYTMPQGAELSRDVTVTTHGEWWLENRGDFDPLFESEFIRDALIRLSVGYFDWLKNSWSGKETVRNLKLKAIGTYHAKRESRRLLGDYLMTQQDFIPCDKIPKDQLSPEVIEEKVLSPLCFPDTVAYTGWAIDVHHKEGIFSGKESAFFLNQRCRVTPIPFRSLYSKNIQNLMMAGRNISVTHLALGPTRVMLTGGLMGQAVGTAAFLCKQFAASPRQIAKGHMEKLQALLLHDGVYLPHVKGHDQVILPSGTGRRQGSFISCKDQVIFPFTPTKEVPSDKKPLTLTLPFEVIKKVREISLTFDLPYTKFSYGLEKDLPPMPNIASDFKIRLILPDDAIQEVASVSGNYQYERHIAFDPVYALGVQISISTFLKEGEEHVLPKVRITEET